MRAARHLVAGVRRAGIAVVAVELTGPYTVSEAASIPGRANVDVTASTGAELIETASGGTAEVVRTLVRIAAEEFATSDTRPVKASLVNGTGICVRAEVAVVDGEDAPRGGIAGVVGAFVRVIADDRRPGEASAESVTTSEVRAGVAIVTGSGLELAEGGAAIAVHIVAVIAALARLERSVAT